MHRSVIVSRIGLSLGLLTLASSALAFDVPPSLPAEAIWQEDVNVRGYPSTYITVRCTPQMPDPTTEATHAFGELCAHWRVANVRRAFNGEFKNKQRAAELGLDRYFMLEVPGRTDTPAMARAFARLAGEVELAEADGIGGVAGFIPNDGDFDLQYGMHNVGQSGGMVDADIDAPDAWAVTTGVENPVTIAVIDSGVNPHNEFASRLVPGINTNNPNMPNLTTDACPHGTHVAGILAATGNNGSQVAGMNWGAYIMPVRVLNGCTGTELQCANGITWAVDHGADIINLSVQYYAGTAALNAAVQYAHGEGAVLIAAVGNSAGNVVAWPARFANCMGVSATNHNDAFVAFSNFGNEVDISAPGDNIWSTWINNTLWQLDGTSMAAPHVSGTASLIRSLNPALSNTEIMTILTSTANDKGPAGWDQQYGHGRLNAGAALASVPMVIELIQSIPVDGTIDARQPFDVDGTNPAGIDAVTLRFSGSVSSLTSNDLVVTQEGGAGTAPTIVSINPLVDDTVSAQLSGPITVGAWTTITHTPSGTSIRIGYLPADVNGDQASGPVDILALIDALNGVGPVLQLFATDINRSGLAEPMDILRVIDLLNGAGAYEAFNGATLP